LKTSSKRASWFTAAQQSEWNELEMDVFERTKLNEAHPWLLDDLHSLLHLC